VIATAQRRTELLRKSDEWLRHRKRQYIGNNGRKSREDTKGYEIWLAVLEG